LEFADCESNVPLDVLPAGEDVKGYFTTVVPDLASGDYLFSVTLVNPVCAARNSEPVELKIKHQ
jgi:hypothetical protein